MPIPDPADDAEPGGAAARSPSGSDLPALDLSEPDLSAAGPFLRTADRWLGRLALLLAIVGAIIIVLLTILTGYSVFWRYVLGEPITWIDELSGYLVVLMVMVGVSEALRRGDHINVDLLVGRLGATGQRAVAIWSMLAVIAFGVILLIDGINAVLGVYAMGLVSEGYLEISMWIPQSAIILGSVMLIVTAAMALLRVFAGYPVFDRKAEH